MKEGHGGGDDQYLHKGDGNPKGGGIKNIELISIQNVMMMGHIGIVIMRGSNDRGADTGEGPMLRLKGIR